MITTRIQKWGNNYGIRIPKVILDQMKLPPDVQFEVRTENGAILLTPVQPRPTLESLLTRVTLQNVHGEVDFSPSIGNDVW